jgi:hypothetical protein
VKAASLPPNIRGVWGPGQGSRAEVWEHRDPIPDAILARVHPHVQVVLLVLDPEYARDVDRLLNLVVHLIESPDPEMEAVRNKGM